MVLRKEEKAHRHFIIHKPYGYLSQFIRRESNRKNKKLLGDLYDFPDGTMAVGRLDENSEGLLILTSDGMLSYKIRRPNVEKEYYVQVDGVITDEALQELSLGVEIGFDGKKYKTLPSQAIRIENPRFPERSKKVRDDRHGPTSWVSIIITEGRYRQVRKMTAAVGFPTLRLVRVRIGAIALDQLVPGRVTEVEEVDYFQE